MSEDTAISKEEVQQIVIDMINRRVHHDTPILTGTTSGQIVKFLDATNYLPKEPCREDLLPFLRGKFSTKRLRKKFLECPDRYAKFVIYAVWKEWNLKRWCGLGRVMGEQIYSRINQESFMHRVLVATPVTITEHHTTGILS